MLPMNLQQQFFIISRVLRFDIRVNEGAFDFMKYLLKVTEFHPKPGNQNEMYYIDDEGEVFIGSARNVTIGKIYQVEASTKLIGGSYHRIISWLDAETTVE